jgi:hypothetical protein
VEQFYRELDSNAIKFNTISTYFGMDLFSEIDAHLQGSIENE